MTDKHDFESTSPVLTPEQRDRARLAWRSRERRPRRSRRYIWLALAFAALGALLSWLALLL